MIKSIFTTFLCLFSLIVFSQSNSKIKPTITVGNLANYVRPYTILTTIDSFKQQKIIKTSPGYFFYTAKVYYSGDSLSTISSAQFKSIIGVLTRQIIGDSIYTDGLINSSDTMNNTTTITFDEVLLKDIKTGKIIPADGVTYIFDIKKAHLPNKDQLEFHHLKSTIYLSGNIYFSGTNFSQVFLLKLNPSKPAKYDNIFSKTTIGSVVTFENVIYRNEDGSLSMLLSKTIKVTPELIDKTVIY